LNGLKGLKKFERFEDYIRCIIFINNKLTNIKLSNMSALRKVRLIPRRGKIIITTGKTGGKKEQLNCCPERVE